MSRNRVILLAGLGAIVFAMVVWGLASSSMGPVPSAAVVPADDDALHYEARGQGDQVQLAQVNPAGVPPLVPGMPTPVPGQPTPNQPTPNAVTPAPAPTLQPLTAGFDAGTTIPLYGRSTDGGISQNTALDAGAPATEVAQVVTPVTDQTVAAEVVSQVEEARAARRADLQNAEIDLSNVNAQLATGDTAGAIDMLSAVSGSLGPAAQEQLRAAQVALDNKDLTNARIYIDNAMALRRR